MKRIFNQLHRICALTLMVVLAILYSSNIYAQVFENLLKEFSVEDGLPSMTVYDVLEDRQGFIWFSTEAGVSKYDGYTFKTLSASDGLIHNEVVRMFLDSEDRIWMNSSGPLSYIKNDSVHVLKDAIGPNLNWNFSVMEEENGLLWFCDAGNVSCYNVKTLDPVELDSSWFFEGSYINFVDKRENQFYFLRKESLYTVEDGKVIDSLDLQIKFDRYSRIRTHIAFDYPLIYYNTSDGITELDLETKVKRILDPDLKQVKKIVKFKENLIITTPSHGAIIYNIDSNGTLKNKKKVLSDLNICNFLIDKNDNIWLPTYRSGVKLFRPSSESIIDAFGNQELRNTSFEHIFLDPEGTIWLGAQFGLLFKLDGNKVERFRHPFSLVYGVSRIVDIDYIDTNYLLLSTDIGHLLFRNGEFFRLTSIAAKNADVFGNRVLLSTYSCVFESTIDYFESLDSILTTSDLKNISEISMITSERSYACEFDRLGNSWVGTEDHGLMRLNGKDTSYYSKLNPLFATTISDIETYQENGITVAFKGEGIVLLKGNEYIAINENNGLSNNTCNDMFVQDNFIYAATNRGLNIIEIIDFENSDFKIHQLDNSYGLKTEEIRSVTVRNDTLFLATHEGVITIKNNFEKFNEDRNQIPFYFTKITTNNKDLKLENSYELDPEDDNIFIEFTGLDYIRSDQLLYAYKMEGIDEDWIYTRSTEAHYSNLKPGNYVFKAGIASSKNDIMANSRSIEFDIKPHITQTLLFKTLLGVFALFLVFSSIYFLNIRQQRNRLSKMVKQKTMELDMKVSDLANANSLLEQSNQDLQSFAYVTSHDLKSPLRNVSSFIQLLELKNRDNFDEKDNLFIQFSKSGVEKMERTIDDLLLYSSLGKDEELAKVSFSNVLNEIQSELKYLIREKNAKVIVQANLPTIFSHYSKIKQLFQNLIQNGLKYNISTNGIIEIDCVKEGNYFQFSVSDNGIGIERAYHEKIFNLFQRLHNDKEYEGTGIGLAICKRIIDSYGGKIWLESIPGNGSTFYFTIPISLEV